MTLSSEIIAKGEILCGQCPDTPAIRKVAHIKKDLIEVEACQCGDPEFNLDAKLVQTGEIQLMDDAIFGSEPLENAI